MADYPPFSFHRDGQCTCDHCQGVEWPPIPTENLERFASDLAVMLPKFMAAADKIAAQAFTDVYAEHDSKTKP